MRSNDTSPHQSGGPRQHRHDSASNRSPPSECHVLADALAQNRYQDGECVILCPECSEVIERFQDGLPTPFLRLSSSCPNCYVKARPWNTVVTSPVNTAVPTDTFRQCVQDYWDRQFRIGASDPSLPYTREFSDTAQELANKWRWDWEVTCPLCNRAVADLSQQYLGYHHWWYQPDCGTSLCHPCHDYVHGAGATGPDDRQRQAIKQNWRAKDLGLRDLRDLGVIRIALRDRTTHDTNLNEDDPKYAERLKYRYNVPLKKERIRALVADIRHDDDVAEVLDEYGETPEVTSTKGDEIPIRKL